MNDCAIIGCDRNANKLVETPHDDKLWYCKPHVKYMQHSTGKKDGYEVLYDDA